MNALPVKGKTATRVPETWESVAVVLKYLQHEKTVKLLTVEGQNFSSLYIDLSRLLYTSETPIADLPETPKGLNITAEALDPSNTILADENWLAVDELLWTLGHVAFEGRLASWLSREDIFTLTKWPNLSGLKHSVEELRMVPMLAAMPYTVDNLIAVTQVKETEALELLSKLSLLDALKSPKELPVEISALAEALLEPTEVIQSAFHIDDDVDTNPVITTADSLEAFENDETPAISEQFDGEDYDLDVLPEAPIEEMPALEDHELNPPHPEPEDESDDPIVMAHVYPAFDPTAPPPPIVLRKAQNSDPSLRFEESFDAIIKDTSESQSEDKENPKEKQKRGFFGKLLKKD